MGHCGRRLLNKHDSRVLRAGWGRGLFSLSVARAHRLRHRQAIAGPRETTDLKTEALDLSANLAAQRFYLREGFVEKKRTDGQRNSEGLPDIEYHWHAQEMETAT